MSERPPDNDEGRLGERRPRQDLPGRIDRRNRTARIDARLGSHDVDLERLKRTVRYLAEITGIDADDLLIAQSPGVRYDMPHTFNEHRVWSELKQ